MIDIDAISLKLH